MKFTEQEIKNLRKLADSLKDDIYIPTKVGEKATYAIDDNALLCVDIDKYGSADLYYWDIEKPVKGGYRDFENTGDIEDFKRMLKRHKNVKYISNKEESLDVLIKKGIIKPHPEEETARRLRQIN